MMRMGSIARISTAIAAGALLLAPGAGIGAEPRALEAARGTTSAQANETTRAVIMQVLGRRVRVRALDGVMTWLVLTPKAEILLNGKPARLTDLRKGFVAESTLNAKGRVTSLKVTGRLPVVTETGVLQTSDGIQVGIRRADATILSIPVDATTTVVMIDAQPATLADLAPRMRVVVRRRGSDPAFRIDASRVLVTDRGTIESVTPQGMVLRLASGLPVPIPFAPDSVVRIALRLGTIADVKVGGVAEVQHLTGGPALLIRLPRGA